MAAVQTTPAVRKAEIQVLDDAELKTLFAHLRGRPLYMPVVLAASTGMRRGELLALRWSDVDLDRAILRVEQSLEQTKAGLRFKSPKTKHGRRSIALPASAVSILRRHRKDQCLAPIFRTSDLAVH